MESLPHPLGPLTVRIDDMMPVFMAEMDIHGVFIKCHGNVIIPGGFSTEDLVGRSAFDVFHGSPDGLVLLEKAISGEPMHRTVKAFNRVYQVNLFPFTAPCGSPRLWSVALDITERLSESRDLRIAKAALDSSVSGKSMIDLEGRITYVNPAAERMWGYEPGEVIGMIAKNFWLNPEESERSFKELIAAGKGEGRMVAISKQGNPFTVAFTASLVLDELGSPAYMLGSFMDVTPELNAQLELKENQQLLTSIAENLSGLIARYQLWPDGKERFLYLSKGVEEIYEVSIQDALVDATFLWRRIHQDDHAVIRSSLEQSKLTGRPFSAEWRANDSHGRTHYLYGRGNPHFQSDLSVIWDILVLEVTPLKKAELELKSSKERLAQVIDATQDGIYDLNNANNDVFMSPRCKELLGVNEEEANGIDWTRFVDESMREEVRHHCLHPDVYGDLYCLEYLYHRRDGSSFWLQDIGKVLRDESGSIVRTVGSIRDITDRKLQERALAESEERYNLALAGSSDGIWDWQVQEDMVYFSDRYREMVPLEGGKYLKGLEQLQKVIHPEDYLPTLAALENHFVSKVPFHHEYRIKVRDGSYRWFLVRGQAIWDESGVPIRMAGSLTDIHDGKQAQLELERINGYLLASEARFRAFMDNSPVAAWISTPEGSVEYANAGYHQHFKAEPLDIGRHFSDIFPQFFLEEHHRNTQRVVEGGKPIHIRERAIRPDGSYGEFMVYIFPVPKAGGGVNIGGVAIDITDRSSAEKELDFERYFSAQLIENMLDGISVVNPDGMHVNVNQALCDITGYSKEELLHSRIPHVYWPEEHSERIIEEFKEVVPRAKEGKGKAIHLVFKRKNGERFPALISPSAVMDHQGNPVLLFATIKDITDIKNAERELMEKNEALEKANVELDRIVYSTSHDLRAPLLSVMGLIDLASKYTSSNEDLAQLLTMMRKGIQRSDAAIKDILEFSRNARTELKYEAILVKEEIQAFVDSIRYMPEADGIRFDLTIDDSLVIRSDKKRFLGICHNLITNAVKYQRSDHNDQRVEIAFWLENHQGVLRVEDTGEGIPETLKESVFDMFVRHSAKSTGSGLGLYMCKEMVQKLHGTIHLESTLGHGTIFTVRIPNQNYVES